MRGKPDFAHGTKSLLEARRERLARRAAIAAERAADPAVQLCRAERAKRPIAMQPAIIAAKRAFEAEQMKLHEARRPGRKTKRAWIGPMREPSLRAQVLSAIDDAALRRRCEVPV